MEHDSEIDDASFGIDYRGVETSPQAQVDATLSSLFPTFIEQRSIRFSVSENATFQVGVR